MREAPFFLFHQMVGDEGSELDDSDYFDFLAISGEEGFDPELYLKVRFA